MLKRLNFGQRQCRRGGRNSATAFCLNARVATARRGGPDRNESDDGHDNSSRKDCGQEQRKVGYSSCIDYEARYGKTGS